MFRFLIFVMILATNFLVADVVAIKPVSLNNPISKGLHPYGMRDFQIFIDNNTYYLLGTEMVKPGSKKRGIVLYSSKNLNEWKEVAILIDREKLSSDCWYFDDFKSPKIFKFKTKYYLTFSANNFEQNPYGSCGVAIAIADKIDGTYKISTPNTPITLGNNFSLNLSESSQLIAYWDRDGKIFRAEMSENGKQFKTNAVVALDQGQLRRDDHFLDAPSLFLHNDSYFMLYTVFKGGYRLSYSTSKSLKGTWEAPEMNDVFYRSEDQASTVLKNTYPKDKTYAPPCEIIGHAQLFTDLDGQLRIAYHSEDKYAEPFLCIDYAEIVDQKVICKPTLK